MVTAEDVSGLFGGDMDAARDFVNKMRFVVQADGADLSVEEEQEQREQQRLKVLQLTVERLETQLKQLRGALHEALIAPVEKNMAAQGFTVNNEGQQQALPGAVYS